MTKQITTFSPNTTGIAANNVISSATEIVNLQNTQTAVNNTGEVVAENRELLEGIYKQDCVIAVDSTKFTGGTNELAIVADAITYWDQSVYTADKTADATITGWGSKTITGLTSSNTFYIWATFVSGSKDYEATNVTAALPSNVSEKALIGVATVSGGGAVTFASSVPGPIVNKSNYFIQPQYFLGGVFIKGGSLPEGFHNVRIEYTSASTITIKAGSRVRSSDDTEDIIFATDTAVGLSVSGAGGLDTGSEASNTWYNLYAIKNPTSGAVSAVFSVTNEAVSGSITLPSGYTKKRQLRFAARNDGSSNILQFNYRDNHTVLYTNFEGNINGTSPFSVLNAGSATVDTDVVLSSFVPPISRMSVLFIVQRNQSAAALRLPYVKTKGQTNNGFVYTTIGGASRYSNDYVRLATDSAQTIQYNATFSDVDTDVNVLGFDVTEVL